MIKILSTKGQSTEKSPEPVFVIRDGKLFRTIYHPDGWSDNADYELKDDGMIYRTFHHQLGHGDLPDYEIRKDKKLYRTADHPEGLKEIPEFELRD